MRPILKLIFTVAILFVAFSAARGQKIATFKLIIPQGAGGIDVPASVDLDAVTYLPDSAISLVEIKGSKQVPVPYQIENKGRRFMYWLVKQDSSASKKHVFELLNAAPQKATEQVNVEAKDGALIISANNRNLLQYNYKTVYPPAGVDTVFKRSGFIHPFWSPHGQALTQISPSDHRHHFGLWNPWTHLIYEGKSYDLWNLISRQGTVKFAGFVALNEGPVFGSYQTVHHHIIFTKDKGEKVIMNELQSVRIYEPQQNQDYYIMDITIQLNAATDSAVLLVKHPYGSLGWRATAKWNKNNSEVLTSEGKTRANADGSRARWCIVQGQIDDDYAGAVMMTYPTNYNYPEPLRVWPLNVGIGNGANYANFCPVKNMNWLIENGKNYVLKYRFIVYNGHYDKAKAESAWQSFANPPVIDIKINKP
jgi:hypothetical protein